METAIGEALSAAHDATVEAVAAAVEAGRETADEQVQRALDEAEAQLSDAQRTAERIAAAAEQSHLMQAFEAFKQEIRTWLADQESKLAKLPALETMVTEAQAQLSALALVQTAQSSSTPQILPGVEEIQTATEQVTEMLPESLSESAVVESPVPEISRPKRRWI